MMKLRNHLAEIYDTDPIRACRLALRFTTRSPEHSRIDEINRLLGLYGVEAIRGDWQNGYWCDIVATYCNTGDSYAVTVIHVRGDFNGAPGRFRVSTVGDFVERNERKYHFI